MGCTTPVPGGEALGNREDNRTWQADCLLCGVGREEGDQEAESRRFPKPSDGFNLIPRVHGRDRKEVLQNTLL